MYLPPPPGHIRLDDALKLTQERVPDREQAALRIAEACVGAKLATAYRNRIGATHPLDPAVWERPNWRTFFDTGMVLVTLPLVEDDGKPVASGATVQCEREIFLRKGSFEAFLATIEGPKHVGGRPPADDWEAIDEAFFKEVEIRGAPDRLNEKGWQTRADVGRWIRGKSSIDVSETTLKRHASRLFTEADRRSKT